MHYVNVFYKAKPTRLHWVLKHAGDSMVRLKYVFSWLVLIVASVSFSQVPSGQVTSEDQSEIEPYFGSYEVQYKKYWIKNQVFWFELEEPNQLTVIHNELGYCSSYGAPNGGFFIRQRSYPLIISEIDEAFHIVSWMICDGGKMFEVIVETEADPKLDGSLNRAEVLIRDHNFEIVFHEKVSLKKVN